MLTGSTLLLAAAMPVSAAGVGFGHSIARGPFIELTLKLAEGKLAILDSSSVLGALRLVECGGSVVGLLIL